MFNTKTNIMNNLVVKKSDIDRLEEEIKENVEWLYTTQKDEVECIGVENLEGILSRFFNEPVKLQQL